MDHDPEIKAFIRKHADLFWYTPKDKVENINLDFLVEHILNYGDLKTIKELFEVVGIDKVAAIFFANTEKSERNKGNYFELVYHFFKLYFQRHALRNT